MDKIRKRGPTTPHSPRPKDSPAFWGAATSKSGCSSSPHEKAVLEPLLVQPAVQRVKWWALDNRFASGCVIGSKAAAFAARWTNPLLCVCMSNQRLQTDESCSWSNSAVLPRSPAPASKVGADLHASNQLPQMFALKADIVNDAVDSPQRPHQTGLIKPSLSQQRPSSTLGIEAPASSKQYGAGS